MSKNTVKNATKQQMTATQPKNSVKIATPEMYAPIPTGTPRNSVTISGIVCAKSIYVKDGHVSFDLAHSMGFNPKTKEKNQTLFIRCQGSDNRIGGLSEVIKEKARVTIKGQLVSYSREYKRKEEEENTKVRNLVLVISEIYLFEDKERNMPSVNKFELTGFILKDRINRFDNGIVRFSLSHPFMKYVNKKTGEEVTPETAFINCVYYPKNKSELCIDTDIIQEKERVLVTGSIKPNVCPEDKSKTGRMFVYNEFSVNTIEVLPYEKKDNGETEMAQEED